MVQVERSGPVSATQTPAFQGNPAELGDARSQMVGRRVSDLAEPGSDAQRLLRYTHDAMRGGELNLRHFPPEVAQMILDHRGASMQEFLNTWSDSIREQAELDKEADKRRQLLAQVLGRVEGVDPSMAALANEIRADLGLPDLSQASVDGGAPQVPERRPTLGLQEPEQRGVRLRGG